MASRAETLRSIREEWKEETGTDPGEVGASVLLDKMAAAFGEKVAGAGYEYAVREDPRTAKYLMWRWEGDEGRKLREAIEEAGV